MQRIYEPKFKPEGFFGGGGGGRGKGSANQNNLSYDGYRYFLEQYVFHGFFIYG